MSGFTCDWPEIGGVCGKPATWYLDGGSYQRPMCKGCVQLLDPSALARAHRMDAGGFDPMKVPGARKKFVPARPDVDKTAEPLTEIAVVAPPEGPDGSSSVPQPEAYIYRETVRDTEPPCPPSAPAMPSRPPLRAAFTDFAVAVLKLATSKVEGMK
jgi:hypothetical protein